MTATVMTDAQDMSAAYEVGYGKPPRHTQFRKGQSGNPGGRPRGRPVRRANALLLQEAYRPVAIKENGRIVPVPALQAILRSQIELAINGNVRAQHAVFKAVEHLEFPKAFGNYYDRIEIDEDGTDENDLDEDGETGEVDVSGDETDGDETGETRSDETGEAVKTAAEPAPPGTSAAPPALSAAPPVRPATPEAPRQVTSALRRPGSPLHRHRTPAPAGPRGGRPHDVTRKHATDGGPAGGQPGQIRRTKPGPADNSGKIPC